MTRKADAVFKFYGHTDSDRLSGLSIHDNIVYNCPYDGILVGASDAAYKPWISDAAVYNNIVYNTGGGIRIDNPGVAARVLHNTVHKNSTSLKLEAAKSAEVRNKYIKSTNQESHKLRDGGVVVTEPQRVSRHASRA